MRISADSILNFRPFAAVFRWNARRVMVPATVGKVVSIRPRIKWLDRLWWKLKCRQIAAPWDDGKQARYEAAMASMDRDIEMSRIWRNGGSL